MTEKKLKPNRDLMKEARESLKDNWGMAIVASLLFMIIQSAGSFIPILGGIAQLVITGPITLGLALFYLELSRKKTTDINTIFKGFNDFGRSLVAYLLVSLFVFLWLLLFIVPGIIAGLSYSLVFYILADDKKIEAMEALRKSKQMMKGKKWKLFCLTFRFFGWFLLCLLTFGIGFLWFMPYMQMSMAKFYEDVKG